ncbi:hypothetical protein [Marinicella sp. W31]|uniref:hypothetical protein n=1 Tax=Marinicella sp. W31 TaxID=3023713 RepID=UPI0037578088
MNKLYKYVPSQYLESVFEKGELLFRNMSYFKQCEGKIRGDLLEGTHWDNPDNDIAIKGLTKRVTVKGNYSILNSIDSDLIFIFCLSKKFDEVLFSEFNCDACIEIYDIEEFIKRVRFAVRRLIAFREVGLLHREVMYYETNEPLQLDLDEVKNLVFMKEYSYSNQKEYRLVLGKKNSLKRKVRIIDNDRYSLFHNLDKGTAKEKKVTIGNLSDIAKIHISE